MRITPVGLLLLALGAGCSGAPVGSSTLTPTYGAPARQLTFSPAKDFAPVWTPDGRAIIYISDETGEWGLRELDPRAPAPRALTLDRYQYTNPFVTPDGSIAVASDRGSSTRAWLDLWLLERDGTRERRLISETPSVKEFVPAISPDGRLLAYLDLPMNRPPQYRLIVVELSGGLPRILTEDRVEFSPIRFSPDGRHILFTSSRMGSADVWTIGVDGGGARPLTNRPSREVAGDWSRDGAAIVFVSNQNGMDELWLMDPQGQDVRQLTSDLATASLPAFSPDGSQVVYTSTKSRNEDLWIISLRPLGLTQ
ncbi:MAG: hypothetical protein ABIO65_06020 [Nitrospiria bacterium]